MILDGNSVFLIQDFSISRLSLKVFFDLRKVAYLCCRSPLKTANADCAIGALGLIKKGTKEYTEQIPGKPSLYEIQKIVLSGTAHALRRALTI